VSYVKRLIENVIIGGISVAVVVMWLGVFIDWCNQ
jgi:hypothetical protein